MLRFIFGGYCLALCAMFIGATVQAERPDPVSEISAVANVPLPSLEDVAIVTAGIELFTPITVSRTTPDGTEVSIRTVGGNRAIVTIAGEKTEMIIDPPVDAHGNVTEFQVFLEIVLQSELTKSTNSWVTLNYDRFDVYVDTNFYNSQPTNTFEDFFNLFEPRYEYMESLTGWTSEQFYGKKLEIYVTSTAGCWGGYAIPGEAHLSLHEDFSNPDICRRAYYKNGIPYFNNPGELGDQWGYTNGALHESLHSINPFPVFVRAWLTEGFSMYNQYNILVDFNDINQETSDIYLLHGTSQYNWEGYVNNDYYDTSQYNNPIQDSAGYCITGWMFSMLRNDYSLYFADFYNLMSTNYETLDKASTLDNSYYPYSVDMVIIDLFGRALDMDFNEIKTVFRYDGPDGPGWGVREWVSTEWYADLTPELGFSISDPIPGETIDLVTTVYNNGDTDANDFSVRFYEGETLLNEQIVSVGANSFLLVTTPYIGSEGIHTLSVYIDEDNIKMETDETNNEDIQPVTFETCCVDRVGDANGVGGDEPTIGDVSTMIDAKFITGSCDGIIECLPEADINQSGDLNPACSDVTIGDISTLIDYLFITGPELGLPDCL